MANVDRPNGFKPVGTVSGSPWQGAVRTYPVDASNATAIFNGDAVTLETDGNVTPAAAGGVILGVVVGIEVDRSVAATEHPGYLPATTAGNVRVCIAPDAIYEVQEDSVGGALDAGAVGSNIDHVAGAGSTTTGNSAHELDSSSLTAAGSAGFRIVGLVDRVDNEIGTNAKWLVRVHESHFAATNGI